MDTERQIEGHTNNSEPMGAVSHISPICLLPTKPQDTKHWVIWAMAGQRRFLGSRPLSEFLHVEIPC